METALVASSICTKYIPFDKLEKRYNIDPRSKDCDYLLEIISQIGQHAGTGTSGLLEEIFDLYADQAGDNLQDMNKLMRSFSYFVRVVNFHHDFEKAVVELVHPVGHPGEFFDAIVPKRFPKGGWQGFFSQLVY